MTLCLESMTLAAYTCKLVRGLKICNTRRLLSVPVQIAEHCSMMIVDAIRSAPTQHAVYFLVTAYIESLRHFERTCGVPAEVLALPLDGLADLAERTRVIGERSGNGHESVAISELAAVLDCAIEQLMSLEEPHAAGAIVTHARNDSRRSALSV